MNGKKLLEIMNGIDMTFVEEAIYPIKKKNVFRWTKMATTAACLVAVLTLGTITYASGAMDAIKSYFSTQNSTVETLLQDGALSVTDGKVEMRVENYIADYNAFAFTVSLLGTGNTLRISSDDLETAWITNSGERITDYNKEFGAYIAEDELRGEFGAYADSMYEDADATFMVINMVPDGYSIEELESVEVKCKGLTLNVQVGDSVVETYTLSPTEDIGRVTNFTASAIGFSFITDITDLENLEISMIKVDGSYIDNLGASDTEGNCGFWLSASSIPNSEMFSVNGHWAGGGAIAIGVLDLDTYSGIRVNGVDYFFDR